MPLPFQACTRTPPLKLGAMSLSYALLLRGLCMSRGGGGGQRWSDLSADLLFPGSSTDTDGVHSKGCIACVHCLHAIVLAEEARDSIKHCSLRVRSSRNLMRRHPCINPHLCTPLLPHL